MLGSKRENMKFVHKFEKEINAIVEFKEAYTEFLVLNSKHVLDANGIARKKELREKLNLLSGEVSKYVRKTGIPASIYYSPPPAIGGMASNIGLFENIFNLRQFNIPPQTIFDMLDKAIGNFRFFQKEHKRKIKNPFYWIGRVIRLPFSIFSFAGFNGSKIEASLFGKIYKLLVGLLLLISAIATILTYCGISFGDLARILSN